MSLRSVCLENFRGFEEAEIAIEPLTVLVGANSSGKSSFSHALAALSHAQRTYRTSPKLTLSPKEKDLSWPADLGALQDVRRSGAAGPVCISVQTDEGRVTWGFGLDDDTRNTPLEISYIQLPAGMNVNSHQPSLREPTAFFPVAASGTFVLNPELLNNNGSFQTYRKINPVQWREEPGGAEFLVDLRGLTVQSAFHPTGTGIVLNAPVRREIESIFGELAYLRAVRNRPTRMYESQFAAGEPLVGYGGEGFASLLNRFGQEPITSFFPPVESRATRNEHSFLRSEWKQGTVPLIDAVRRWLLHLRLATDVQASPHPRNPDLLQIRITVGGGIPHDISEVGFGISQVLPILVAGLLQPQDGPFVVDLPEAHLHPKPQALVADFFCALALSGKRCLVETHSEMFVNQLRLRVAMEPSLLKDIAVYFFDDAEKGACHKPRRIGLDQEGQLEWPIGFLEEAWDVESKISDIRISERVAS